MENKETNKTGKYHYHFLIFKLLLFFLCLSCVLYQVPKFLAFYWSYPEVIDRIIENDREVLIPAITVCDPGAISRKKFCEKFPSECENVTKEHWMCVQYPSYCKEDENFTMPDNSLHVDENFFEFAKSNARKPYNAVKTDYGSWSGPFIYGGYSGPIVCFTLNSHVYNGDNSTRRHLQKYTSEYRMDIEFVLDISKDNDDDHMFPWTEPGFYIHVHSPFIHVNPRIHGTFVKRGRNFIFHYRMEEEYLLPPPYKSDCKNYITEWEKNNEIGPRSKESCVEHCYKKADCKFFGQRLFGRDQFPASYCEELFHEEEEDEYDFDLHWKEISSCKIQCKPDCVNYKYPYTIEQVPAAAYVHEVSTIWVVASLEEEEIRILKHRPQYQGVELFSFIGGFLGFWLGISIYSLAEIEKTYTLLKSGCHWLKQLRNHQRPHVLENEETSDPECQTENESRI